jgi:pimeloyl-ACP methyl ester carboxylesterase
MALRSPPTLGQPSALYEVEIPPLGLPGTLRIPSTPRGLVIFAHGSGSSRFSPRNTYVAHALNDAGFATLLFDLLRSDEETDRRNVFDIAMLAGRLVEAVAWSQTRAELKGLRVGLFGASTGGAAALSAAAQLGDVAGAVISRGGRPDLAGKAIDAVRAPTLLIVGGRDVEVLSLNSASLAALRCTKELKVIPGATHLFPEAGALDCVISAAEGWFSKFLAA